MLIVSQLMRSNDSWELLETAKNRNKCQTHLHLSTDIKSITTELYVFFVISEWYDDRSNLALTLMNV